MRSLRRLVIPVVALFVFLYFAQKVLTTPQYYLPGDTPSKWRSPASTQGSKQKPLESVTPAANQGGDKPYLNYRPPEAVGVQKPFPKENHPVSSLRPLPTNQPSLSRKIQFDFPPESKDARKIREARLDAVKEACRHSMDGYVLHAFPKDEVAPVTGGYRTTLGGWGVTLFDSLDLLWIAGLEEEFEKALAAISWVEFEKPDSLPINVFEVTIRYLGGLLGAYDVSGGKYSLLLKKAVELGDMLYPAFDTLNRMPVLHWHKLGVEVAGGETLLAELGSLSLEFTRLAILTGDIKYYDAVQRITDHFEAHQNKTKLPGMWPTTLNAREVDMGQGLTFSLAGASDSMYEYLVKEHILLGGRTDQYKSMYTTAIEKIEENLFFTPMTPRGNDILFAGVLKVLQQTKVELVPEMSHLTCFAGGMVALGAKVFDRAQDLAVAKKLVDGCIWAHKTMPSGIMPEKFNTVRCPSLVHSPCKWEEEIWGKDMIARNSNDDNHADKSLPLSSRISQKSERLRLPKGISAISIRQYLLRPEAIESLFVLYRITGDERFRDEAWTMFKAITEQTRTDIAYSSIDDVTVKGSRKLDRMESYWPAETLKYFLLIFSTPDVISLDEFVFNTEGHPFVVGYNSEEVLIKMAGTR